MPWILGKKKIFFIDWVPVFHGDVNYEPNRDCYQSFGTCQGVRLVTEKCKKSTPLLKPDKPWEDSSIMQGTVILNSGRYRLWYGAMSTSYFEEQSNDRGLYLCYAESKDGYHWIKPKLGVVSYQGNKDNNIVSGNQDGPWADYESGSVFIDPGALPEERYKLIYKASVYKKGVESPMRGATSADGIHWNPIKKPILEPYHSDTQTTAYWDPHLRQFVGYFRQWWGERRAIARATTEDFRKWPQPTIVLVLSGPGDVPSHDLYTNAHVLYQTRESDELPEGYRRYLSEMDVHFMFPAQYSREKDTIDIHLATSRNGISWNYFGDEPVIPLGEPGSGQEGSLYAGYGLVPLGDNEMAVMYLGYPFSHNQVVKTRRYQGTLYWAIWEKDRLVAIEAVGDGAFSTPQLMLKGHQLMLNLRTDVAGEVRVQLRRFNEDTGIPGYSFADCDPIRGDQPAAVVTWRGQSMLRDLAERRVQVDVHMRAARLYCFWTE